jgi:hypothetical protein
VATAVLERRNAAAAAPIEHQRLAEYGARQRDAADLAIPRGDVPGVSEEGQLPPIVASAARGRLATSRDRATTAATSESTSAPNPIHAPRVAAGFIHCAFCWSSPLFARSAISPTSPWLRPYAGAGSERGGLRLPRPHSGHAHGEPRAVSSKTRPTATSTPPNMPPRGAGNERAASPNQLIQNQGSVPTRCSRSVPGKSVIDGADRSRQL